MTPTSKKPLLILIVLGLVLIIAGIFFGMRLGGTREGYQAIFLTNNQVYFGKVSNGNNKYVRLSDVYYIRLDQPQATSTAQDLNLVKLGTELHAPQDAMDINRDQILFIEDLKDDSPVVMAIQNYKRGQGQ